MDSESIVYGYIRDWPVADGGQSLQRREANRRVIAQLPAGEAWSFIAQEMFAEHSANVLGQAQSQVIHFGASYQSIEYEWSLWVREFEALLRRLYWASAVVHLETELNGLHTFRWESEQGYHTPDDQELRVRCVWEREGNLRS